MIQEVEAADCVTRARFDAIIDVRSPSEFDEDHVPGAINLPVLSDAERATVGTLYVQQSKFLARRVGAALVSRNIATHLEGPLSDKLGGFHPLIYCWRGGQRSGAMATVLSQVGWRVGLLKGGYKTYRRSVTNRLYDAQTSLKLVLLTGPTGVGKTLMLDLLARRGLQIIDLEAIAGHRGSLFGGHPGAPQPSQKMFEFRLLQALEGLDPASPTVVEAESSKIGELFVPPALWKAMEAAPCVELVAPAQARARFITQTYGDVGADLERLTQTLKSLPRHHSLAARAAWKDLAERGQWEPLALQLIEAHYDPAYRRGQVSGPDRLLGRIVFDEISPDRLTAAADQAAALIAP